MRPAPIPDAVAALGDGRRIVIGPPGNDLESSISPVEAIAHDLPSGKAFSIRCVLEADDLELLAAGGAVWVTFLGHVVPFDIAVAS